MAPVDPVTAGLGLINKQSLAANSAAGRKATWVSFINRLAENGIDLAAASANELKAKALEHHRDGRPKEHAWRLLRLAEAVMDQLQAEGHLPKGRNAATEARFGLNIDCRNDQTVFLAPLQISSLVAILESPPDPADALKDYRDRAMVALALGAGAPPSAISSTTVSCMREALTSGRLKLSATLPTMKRPATWSAELLPFARGALADYLDQLSDAADEAPAFPGRQTVPMSRVQVFRLIRDTLWNTGIFSDRKRLSPQTLRNSYFALLCDNGGSAEQISASMGWVLGDQEQFRRMRRFREEHRLRCAGLDLRNEAEAGCASATQK